jgi:hypothetical protein
MRGGGTRSGMRWCLVVLVRDVAGKSLIEAPGVEVLTAYQALLAESAQ